MRRWATVAIFAAALIEIAIVLQLGLFSRSAHADAEIDALLRDQGEIGDALEPEERAAPHPKQLASMVIGALGIVALIFAALAIMAAGLR